LAGRWLKADGMLFMVYDEPGQKQTADVKIWRAGKRAWPALQVLPENTKNLRA
jgi:hypothetical protein